MIKLKKCSYIELFLITYQIAPFHAVAVTIEKLIESLFPALSVIVIANFIDSATGIFRNGKSGRDIFLPLTILVVFIAFQFLFGVIMGFVHNKMDITVNTSITNYIINLKAKLLYKYYENQDSNMRIERVLGNLSGNTHGIFNNVLGLIGFMAQFLGLSLVFIAITFGRRDY